MPLPAANSLAALRRRLAALEAVPSLARMRGAGVDAGPLACCGVETAPSALHEVAARAESDMAAASGFVLALAAWTAQARATLWIAEDMALAESGAPYGPGLEAFGLKPERLIRIAVAHEREVLWAMEEGLRCRGIGAVIGEVRGVSRGVGLTESRRLALAAGREGGTAFLLRAVPVGAPLAAATRWIVGAAPSVANPHGPGPPRLDVHLTRNRRGSQGSWVVEWNSGEQRFDLAAADRQPVAAANFDRPDRAAEGA
jgi:protein ImuA